MVRLSLFERFRYDLPAKMRGRFVSPVWDTGNVSHGVAVLPHADLWALHGCQVQLELEPLRPLTAEELALLPRSGSPVCAASAGNDDLPGVYSANHFLFLPQQVEGATLGRNARLEAFAGWLCVVGIGKVDIEKQNGRDYLAALGYHG